MTRENSDLYRKLDASPCSLKICLRQIDGPRHEVRSFTVSFLDSDTNLNDEEKKKFAYILSTMIGCESNWFMVHDGDDETYFFAKKDEFI